MADSSQPKQTPSKRLPHSYLPASGPAEAPDLSGYDRNVRAAKMLQGIDGTGKQQPVDDPFSEPFTLIEKWIRRVVLVISVLVGIGFIMLAVAVVRKLWL